MCVLLLQELTESSELFLVPLKVTRMSGKNKNEIHWGFGSAGL